jgi:hypothetical protein
MLADERQRPGRVTSHATCGRGVPVDPRLSARIRGEAVPSQGTTWAPQNHMRTPGLEPGWVAPPAPKAEMLARARASLAERKWAERVRTGQGGTIFCAIAAWSALPVSSRPLALRRSPSAANSAMVSRSTPGSTMCSCITPGQPSSVLTAALPGDVLSTAPTTVRSPTRRGTRAGWHAPSRGWFDDVAIDSFSRWIGARLP